jgi:C-terminal processing protease CtpA/Prc
LFYLKVSGVTELGGVSIFSEDPTFDQIYEANVHEEILNIYAPAGKLGVVIDTPNEGAPVVHAVKETSIIAGKIQVGDKLVAVDERTMTAIKVSKLLSQKSNNESRKLTVVRLVKNDKN